MKINLQETIKGMMKEPLQAEGKDLTLKRALLLALIQPEKTQEEGTIEKAILTRALFDRLVDAEESVDLKAEEIVFLKQKSAKGLAPLIAGSICLMLEKSNDGKI